MYLDHQASTLVDPLMREAMMRMMRFLTGPLGNPHSAASTGERVYADLLARMAPEAWRGLAIRLGDQCVLNHLLRRPPDTGELDVQLPRLRCRGDPCPHRPRCRAGQGAAFKDLVKPWAPDAMLRWARGELKLPYRLAAAPSGAGTTPGWTSLARMHLDLARSGWTQGRRRDRAMFLLRGPRGRAVLPCVVGTAG